MAKPSLDQQSQTQKKGGRGLLENGITSDCCSLQKYEGKAVFYGVKALFYGVKTIFWSKSCILWSKNWAPFCIQIWFGIVTSLKIHRLPANLPSACLTLSSLRNTMTAALCLLSLKGTAKLALTEANPSPLSVNSHRKAHAHFSALSQPKFLQHAPAFCLFWWKRGKSLGFAEKQCWFP